ncbi:histidine kinase [bacterium]|nr:histidine kinase [bacterium]
MVNKASLRTQVYLIIASVVGIIIAGGIIIVFQSSQIELILSRIITKNLARYQIAESLESALINQKGYVTYYYLDKDPDWLKQLGEYRQVFRERLKEMKVYSESDESQMETILHIEKDFELFVGLQDQVINYYTKGETQAGLKLHKEVREYLFNILDACEALKKIQKQSINVAWVESQKKAHQLIGSVIVVVIIVMILLVVLMIILIGKILDPLHKLTLEATKDKTMKSPKDDLSLLGENVRGLIKEADLAHEKLKQNREILIQSEKLALVGKLAAGMAHSIRNPLTSVKMRLFSLGKTLSLNESQQDDFNVISEETKHLDIIVQNFLEFSRPPKLTMQPISLSTVVDQSLLLLRHRLKSYNTVVKLEREGSLPSVMGDAEQLKEVFVNLIVNACESMEKGGSIRIVEGRSNVQNARYAQVQLEDSGPGISDSIIEKIFQPFFTTKDEGTGLGLSIAARIIEDHHGFLRVKSKSGLGTTFTLMLPVIGEMS